MKVSIKDLHVDMELGNRGIELDVYDTSENHLGDLRIGKGKIEWCKGKTRSGGGKSVTWAQLIEFFESRSR